MHVGRLCVVSAGVIRVDGVPLRTIGRYIFQAWCLLILLVQ